MEKKSKTQKKRSKSVKKTKMACQDFPNRFEKIFIEDRKSHRQLTQNYLQKMNELQKESIKMNKKYLIIKTEKKMLEKVNKKVFDQNDKLIKQLSESNRENEFIKKTLKQIIFDFENEKKEFENDFEKEKEFFHFFYKNKIEELRNFYKNLVDQQKEEKCFLMKKFGKTKNFTFSSHESEKKENLTKHNNHIKKANKTNVENYSFKKIIKEKEDPKDFSDYQKLLEKEKIISEKWNKTQKEKKEEEERNIKKSKDFKMDNYFGNFLSSTTKKRFSDRNNSDLLKMYQNRQKIEENLEKLQKEIEIIKSL